MAKSFRPKRNFTAKSDVFTGKPYEVTLDCERQELRIHDGITAGGIPTARNVDLKQSTRVSHTQYAVGDTVACPKRAGVYLVCASAGKTGSSDLDFTNAVPGSIVVDGTVSWIVTVPFVSNVNGIYPDADGRVNVSFVSSVNGVEPDVDGTVEVNVGVVKVNGMTGAVVLSATDVGAISTAGGALEGNLTIGNGSEDINLEGKSDTSGVQVYGGPGWGRGSLVGVYGTKHSKRPGWFYFDATDGESHKQLIGRPDGALTWNNRDLTAAKLFYATCTVPGNNAVKVATVTNSNGFLLEVGSIVAVKMTNPPTAMTHLNVNSSGQKPVKGFNVSLNIGYSGDIECHFGVSPDSLVYVFVYDGTNWNAVTAYGSYEYVPDYDDGGDD